MDDTQTELQAYLKGEISEIVRDMANHTGDQIFDVLKRNGLLMRSEAASTALAVMAAVQVLVQAVDQCNRAAEEDCTKAVVKLFVELLPSRLAVNELVQGLEPI